MDGTKARGAATTEQPTAEFAFNPMSDAVMEDPAPHFARMRSGCPVHHVSDIATPFWMMFRHDDLRSAMLDTATWSNRYGVSPVFQKAIGLFNDGAEHQAFRDVFKHRLTPRALKRFEPQIRRLAERQMDQMLAKGPEVELHDDFALPLPVHVISLLLGISGDDYEQLKHWSDELMDAGFGRDNDEFLRVYQGVSAFFEEHLAAREAVLKAAGIEDPNPSHVGTVLSDDWVSDTVCATVSGRRLSRPEQYILLTGLLVGGNETTTSLITNLMWRLLEAPEHWEALKADPERLIPIAIEESLRFDSPAQGMFRTSLCPVELHGQSIPAKSKLMLAYGSANRDPEVFSDPDSFRLDRPREELSRHVAFGFGAHSCPGAPLSRLELMIVMKMFVERMPDVSLAGPTTRGVGYNFWGRRSVPLRIGSTRAA